MIHLDKLGFELKSGDFVCAHYAGFRQGLGIFKITGITPKMIRLINLETKNNKAHLRYARDTVRLTSMQVKSLLFTALKNI